MGNGLQLDCLLAMVNCAPDVRSNSFCSFSKRTTCVSLPSSPLFVETRAISGNHNFCVFRGKAPHVAPPPSAKTGLSELVDQLALRIVQVEGGSFRV